MQPFIRNHQYNVIRKQAALLERACATVADPKVIEAVRYSTTTRTIEAFPNATEEQLGLLEQIAVLRTSEQFQLYLQSFEPYMAEFPSLTAKQANRLFPKVKKLKLPDLAAIDYRFVTYVGWTDVATGRMYIVYERDGRFVGIEGRFTPAKKGVCFLCNRHEEVALFTSVSKLRPANASPDYYMAIGNYMCVDSGACNKNITDLAALEKFLQAVVGS
ncbi:FusB/FusC family EF-G-binding protein [Paenibacillus sp. LHD-117]|uniref:FusB/FusC family EF-G-binding protein n=1 Tax=Paenibacillus sp. LHD-117 TaxID=3071412 RepID=UPI0027E0D0CC|nr:FusB/FusC family EF-G-binding protein [Paenibacillus sp. LHD-117]MDQ6420586.1 FusB/FusC family EF-G-binding protein [Paenibacillus sp. LHD-117]